MSEYSRVVMKGTRPEKVEGKSRLKRRKDCAILKVHSDFK
jgi:hypothetical protein